MSDIDRRCWEYAARRHGVISHRKARELGLTNRQIVLRVQSGRWRRMQPGGIENQGRRGVYAMAGTVDSWEQRLVAAADFSGGWASHRAAGRLYDLPGCRTAVLEVSTHDRRFRPAPGLLVHHTNRLPEIQRTLVHGVPTTCVERTLLDLAWALPPRLSAVALDDALARGLTDLQSLDRLLETTARRGRRGTTRLREMILERAGERIATESPLESHMLALIREAGLPMPVQQFEVSDRNGFVGRFDLAYPEQRLLIEVQGYRWHSGMSAWQRDLERMNRAVMLGYRLLQVTAHDIKGGAREVLAEIERLLQQN